MGKSWFVFLQRDPEGSCLLGAKAGHCTWLLNLGVHLMLRTQGFANAFGTHEAEGG